MCVRVGGDSMGGELAAALDPILKDARAFTTITFFKESTGICRYDFFDWSKQIRTVTKALAVRLRLRALGAMVPDRRQGG